MHFIQILALTVLMMTFVGSTYGCFVSGPINDLVDEDCHGFTFKDTATKSCFKVFNGARQTLNWFDAMSKCQQFKNSNAFLATLYVLPEATLEKVVEAAGADILWAGGICGSPAISGRNMCFSYVPDANVCGILDNCMAKYSFVCQAYYDGAGDHDTGFPLDHCDDVYLGDLLP